jgi:activator of 2-hydroxyglutaryl-CoA dehydratase
VINCLSQGSAPADIMQGAIASLVDRSVQLMKRVQLEPEVTLVGGILRFETMAKVVQEKLGMKVNVPEGDLVQYIAALGAALLAQHRLRKLNEQGVTVESEAQAA